MGNGRMNITLYGKWDNSLLYNLEVQDNAIVFPKSNRPYGSFVTGALLTGSVDSNEQSFFWENLLIDANLPENSVIRIFCYASDDKMVMIDDRPTDLDSYIRGSSSEQSGEERLKATAGLYKPCFSGALDGLLNASGRYLWIKIECLVPDAASFRLTSLKILYPKEKLLDYLPQIYRDHNENDAFFSRFLNIFESIFFDIEGKVEGLPASLDYTCAKGEMLRYLASFVCIEDNAARLSNKALRERISGSMREYAAIGTRRGVEMFVERELHVKPVIVEYFSVRRMVREGLDRKVYRALFGDDPYRFFVLLPENAFEHHGNAGAFLRELRKNIPAHTEAEIVLLKNSVVLDSHTYLGINSVIGDYNYVSIDRHISISYDTMMGGTKDEEQ